MDGFRSRLCLVNVSGIDLQISSVTLPEPNDWTNEHPQRHFWTASIPNGSSRCHDGLFSKGMLLPYTMTLEFAHGGIVRFSDNQGEAFSSSRKTGNIPIERTNLSSSITLYREAQNNELGNVIYIKDDSILQKNASWMGDVLNMKPDITFRQLAMPGSHDAGMYTASDCTAVVASRWAKTQSSTIYEQLEMGTRYFDLRPYYYKSSLRIGHYGRLGGCMGPELDDILKDVKDFISSPEGREETVILKFSHTNQDYNEDSTEFVASLVVDRIKAVLGEYLAKIDNKYLNNNSIAFNTLPLKHTKGKVIILLDRYTNEGFDSKKEYADMIDKDKGLYQYDNINDEYADTDESDKMYEDQIRKCVSCRDYTNLFLLSWTLTGHNLLNLNISDFADEVNPRLPNVAYKIKTKEIEGFANIYSYDFVNQFINRAIIDVNF